MSRTIDVLLAGVDRIKHVLLDRLSHQWCGMLRETI